MKVNFCLRWSLLLFLIISLNQCRFTGRHPVTFLGLDDSGEEFHHVLSGRHGKRLGKALNDVSEESLHVLDAFEEDNPWELSRIDVGLGITASLEFIVVGVEITPSVRATFKKK